MKLKWTLEVPICRILYFLLLFCVFVLLGARKAFDKTESPGGTWK